MVLPVVPELQGQTTNQPASNDDPMMMLMLSQPKVDVTAPIVPEVSFDPPAIRPGGRSIYRLSLNALREAIHWDGELPDLSFEVRKGAVAQTMQMVGTNMQPRTSFNFHIRATNSGSLTIPSFVLTAGGRRVVIPEARLQVSDTAPLASPQMLQLEVSPESPYVGEAVKVRVLSPASPAGVVQALGQVQFLGEGFIQELTANRQSIETLVRDGKPVAHYIYETTLTPITAGTTDLSAQAFALGNRFSGTIVISGSAVISGSTLSYTLLDSDVRRMQFRSLPPEGRLAGFSGAVGVFSLDPPVLSTNRVSPGEPFTLTLSVRGRANLSRLSLPQPPMLADWQVLPAKREVLPPQVLQARGFANFNFTMVALKGGLKSTPELPFSFFDPERERYVALNVPPVPIEVAAGKTGPELDALLQSRLRNEEKEKKLSTLISAPGRTMASLTPIQLRPWFPLMQLSPAFFFFGLWKWDRRRRYLEAHPEIVLRRRARRHLRQQRRQMKKAMVRNDRDAYMRAVLQAVQEAAAPHFPAHPGAVLEGEVLEVLGSECPDEQKETVRVLFSSTHEYRYSGTGNGAHVLELPSTGAGESRIEALLESLEARL